MIIDGKEVQPYRAHVRQDMKSANGMNIFAQQPWIPGAWMPLRFAIKVDGDSKFLPKLPSDV